MAFHCEIIPVLQYLEILTAINIFFPWPLAAMIFSVWAGPGQRDTHVTLCSFSSFPHISDILSNWNYIIFILWPITAIYKFHKYWHTDKLRLYSRRSFMEKIKSKHDDKKMAKALYVNLLIDGIRVPWRQVIDAEAQPHAALCSDMMVCSPQLSLLHMEW